MHTTVPFRDFTSAARKVMDCATQHALQAHASQVEPEHLLLGLLDLRNGPVYQTLTALQINPDHLRQVLATSAPSAPAATTTTPAAGSQLEHVLHSALHEARHLGHYQVDALHLLMGLLYEDDQRAALVLREAGLSLYDLRQQLFNGPRRWRNRALGAQLRDLITAINFSPIFLIPVGIMIACGLGLFFGSTSVYVTPLTILFVTCGWIVSVCIHEFGHAVAAYLGGDLSVHDAGYLSLNPLKYSHPLLSIIIPVVFMLAGGIGLPGGAVYVNMHKLRNSGWQSIVAAAGPLGTVLFGLLLVWPFFFDWMNWVTPANATFWPALAFLAFLQVTALCFNLLPFPPLDGFNIVAPYLPPEISNKLRMVGNFGVMLLFLLIWYDTPVATWFWSEIFLVADRFQIPGWLVAQGFEQFGW
ncbi:MAG: Clp protease N-terminal domain-containing protein [Chloroflexaceae bacterium]